jgi:curved DNA-binding protein CbpA
MNSSASADEITDPYEILGIAFNATPQEIKKAYRTQALKYHPDKVPPDQKQAATIQFAKIANAYELLTEPAAAAEQQQQQSSFYSNDPYQDPFHQFHHFHFHDPFAVFEQAFREEFGHGNNQGASSMGMFPGEDPFGFMQSGIMGGFFGGFMGNNNSPFGRNPQQQQQQQSLYDRRGGFGFDPFGGFDSFGGGMEDMFNNNHNNGRTSFSTFTSTTTTTTSRGGETVTTTRRNVNGRQESERITHKADGTVERQILNAHSDAAQQPMLDYTGTDLIAPTQSRRSSNNNSHNAEIPAQQQQRKRTRSRRSEPV